VTAAQRDRATVLVLTFAGIAFSLAQTVVVPALPLIQRDLGVTPGAVGWVLSGFLLTSAVSAGLCGHLSDRYGARPVLIGCLVVLAAGCMAAAVAPDLAVLIAARVVQGVSGALFPVAVAALRATVSRESVPRGIALIATTFAFGAAIGIVLAGVLTAHASWRWLFVLTGAVAVIGATAVAAVVRDVRPPVVGRADIAGALWFSVGVTLVLVAITESHAWGPHSFATLSVLVAALVVISRWVATERKATEPVVALDLFKHRPLTLTYATMFCSGFAGFAVFALIALLLAQRPLGALAGIPAAMQVGLLLLPSFGVMFLLGPMTAVALRRVSAKTLMVLGLCGIVAGMGLMVEMHGSFLQLMLGTCLTNGGTAVWLPAATNAIVAAAPTRQVGSATGLATVIRVTGSAFGVQVVTLILASHTVAGGVDDTGYVIAFAVCAALAGLATVAALLIPAGESPLERPQIVAAPVP